MDLVFDIAPKILEENTSVSTINNLSTSNELHSSSDEKNVSLTQQQISSEIELYESSESQFDTDNEPQLNQQSNESQLLFDLSNSNESQSSFKVIKTSNILFLRIKL